MKIRCSTCKQEIEITVTSTPLGDKTATHEDYDRLLALYKAHSKPTCRLTTD